jgi:hypothetical protein
VVLGVLRVRHATCLERSLILQSWLHSHGQAHDVVIGVRHAGSVQAHAWVEDVEPSLDYLEIHRLPAA